MYMHGHPDRVNDPKDRAHDFLADIAVSKCSAEDVEAALRVLAVMTDERHLHPLDAQVSVDTYGNPLTDSVLQSLAWGSAHEARELMARLDHVASTLRFAFDNRRHQGSGTPQDPRGDGFKLRRVSEH